MSKWIDITEYERDWAEAAAAVKELNYATEKFGKFNSAHEGFAVLKEEVDELWDEVKKRPGLRSKEAMKAEAVQVAAMALRFVRDCC